MEYPEEEFLQLSGIQHFSFCRRQWALIHIEQQWQENLLTTEGKIVHERCHNDQLLEKRGDLLVARGLRVFSRILGVTGQCDVVEFHRDGQGCFLKGRQGTWIACPVEYKRGKSKDINADRLQLCAQAMCLEEMLGCAIDKGFLYYAEPHRREEVPFSSELRQSVEDSFREMHAYYARGYTPKVKTHKGCRSCSLREVCLPALCKNKDTNHYFDKFLNGE